MKILLAVDGSDCSWAAVDEIARRPWPAKSCVRILSVVEPPFLPTMETWELPGDYRHHLEQAGMEEAQDAIENAEKRIRESQKTALEISARIIEGYTVTEILDEAASWNADLIVLGSHGRRGLKRFLLGSVSSAVASHADCSVEIVRCRSANKGS
jgi:nucleotide-binding universal stress UspA family protein